MREYLYDIHGVGLRLTTDHKGVVSCAQMFFRNFRKEDLDGQSRLECSFKKVHSREDIPISISPSAKVEFSNAGKDPADLVAPTCRHTMYRDCDRMIIDLYELGLVAIDYEKARMEGYLTETNSRLRHELGLVAIDYEKARMEGYLAEIKSMLPRILLFAFTELLKHEGLFTIHAAALEKGGRGVLIPGVSGRGKTTCCITLLRDGYRCLSDDNPFLRENGNRVELLPFPVKIAVTDKTIELFPELREAKENLYQGLRKRHFYIEDFYNQAEADPCEPSLIIFPKIVDWQKSSLEPLSKSRALEELLNPVLLPFDKYFARQRFQILSRLADKAACYRLYFGEDVLDLPQLIDPLINNG